MCNKFETLYQIISYLSTLLAVFLDFVFPIHNFCIPYTRTIFYLLFQLCSYFFHFYYFGSYLVISFNTSKGCTQHCLSCRPQIWNYHPHVCRFSPEDIEFNNPQHSGRSDSEQQFQLCALITNTKPLTQTYWKYDKVINIASRRFSFVMHFRYETGCLELVVEIGVISFH